MLRRVWRSERKSTKENLSYPAIEIPFLVIVEYYVIGIPKTEYLSPTVKISQRYDIICLSSVLSSLVIGEGYAPDMLHTAPARHRILDSGRKATVRQVGSRSPQAGERPGERPEVGILDCSAEECSLCAGIVSEGVVTILHFAVWDGEQAWRLAYNVKDGVWRLRVGK